MNPRARALHLLEIHNGACSVPLHSDLHREFMKMAGAGRVLLLTSGLPDMVDVYAINFRPKFNRPDAKH